MNDEQLDLARRLARCPQYKPEPVTADYTRRLCGTRVVRDVDGKLIPDLTDAATGGVLLDMLDYTGTGWLVAVSVKQGVRRWAVYERGDAEPGMGWCPFLAEACARALLAEWAATPATPETTAS